MYLKAITILTLAKPSIALSFMPRLAVWSLQRIEPSHQIRIALPTRRFGWPELWIDLFERFSFCFQIRSGIVIRRVELRVSQPTADDSDINTCRDKLNRGRMA